MALDPFSIIIVDADASEAIEAMGTKRKFWFRHEELGQSLYKVARPGTGEDWSEKVVEQLCCLLDLPHARYELASWRETRGVASPTVVPSGSRLIHGNEWLVANVRNYPETGAVPAYGMKPYTLETVLRLMDGGWAGLPPEWEALPGIHFALDLFIGYLLIDAWVGNTDRHHENWAIVEQDRAGEDCKANLYLAPTYDHASSLGRNEPELKRRKRLDTQDSGFSVAAYAKKARSAFHRSEEISQTMTTIETFAEAIRYRRSAAEIWLKQLAAISMSDVESIFKRLPEDRISVTASKFSQEMLQVNRENLLSLLET